MKIEITHVCGHKSTLVLFGKSSAREAKISQAESSLCDECYAVKMAEKATEIGLVPLVGSVKQRGWGDSIRLSIIATIKEIPTGNNEKAMAGKNAVLKYLESQKSASWWIDHRDVGIKGLVHEVMGIIGEFEGREK